MISLRNFDHGDTAFLIEHFYEEMTEQDALALICEWEQKSYKGTYFEMFAILYHENLVGMISLYEHDGAISAGMEVVAAYRRRGIAYEALALALQRARARGAAKATAQVRKNNIASIKLHEKSGYIRCGECINARGNAVYQYEKTIA